MKKIWAFVLALTLACLLLAPMYFIVYEGSVFNFILSLLDMVFGLYIWWAASGFYSYLRKHGAEKDQSNK